MRKRRRQRRAHGSAMSKPHKAGWAGRWTPQELTRLKEGEAQVSRAKKRKVKPANP